LSFKNLLDLASLSQCLRERARERRRRRRRSLFRIQEKEFVHLLGGGGALLLQRAALRRRHATASWAYVLRLIKKLSSSSLLLRF
jgi:hypothetical protein